MANFTKRQWLLGFLLILALIVAFAFDMEIERFIHTNLSATWGSVARWFSNRGLYVFYSVFALLLVYSLFMKNRRILVVLWSYVKAEIIFSFALVRLMKIILGRARPSAGSGFAFFSLDYRHNSFPSGHSADAFVSGVFLFYLLRDSAHARYRYLPLVLAFLIAASRVGVNAHYSSDVIGGIAIGTLGSWLLLSRLPEEPQQE